MSRRFRLLLFVVALLTSLLAPQVATKAHAGQPRAGVATLNVRAIVLQADGGDKLAVVKTDVYIPQWLDAGNASSVTVTVRSAGKPSNTVAG